MHNLQQDPNIIEGFSEDKPLVRVRLLVDSFNEIMTEVCEAVHEQQVGGQFNAADHLALLAKGWIWKSLSHNTPLVLGRESFKQHTQRLGLLSVKLWNFLGITRRPWQTRLTFGMSEFPCPIFALDGVTQVIIVP